MLKKINLILHNLRYFYEWMSRFNFHYTISDVSNTLVFVVMVVYKSGFNYVYENRRAF